MKRILYLVLAGSLLCSSSWGQDVSLGKQAVRKKTAEMIEYHRAGKLKLALRSANEALDLAISTFGEDHQETGIAYKNVGEIHRAQKTFDKAAFHLAKALKIFLVDSEQNTSRILKSLEGLGTSLALDGRKGEAQSVFSETVSFIEKEYGGESRELLKFLEVQTGFSIYVGDFSGADRLFVKRYLFAYDNNGKFGTSTDRISDEHWCYCLRNFTPKESAIRRKGFFDQIRVLRPPDKDTKNENNDKGKILNGRALKLPKPIYPAEARNRFLRGSIPVRIVIGADGRVKNAYSWCGPRVLREASKRAAMKAKFRPTLLSGKPVEVSGTIIYNFQ